jgi:hypothetical protein
MGFYSILFWVVVCLAWNKPEYTYFPPLSRPHRPTTPANNNKLKSISKPRVQHGEESMQVSKHVNWYCVFETWKARLKGT